MGEGAYASVMTGVSIASGKEFAIKIIDKHRGHSRSRIMREIDTFQMCKHHPNIVQLHEVTTFLQKMPLLRQCNNVFWILVWNNRTFSSRKTLQQDPLIWRLFCFQWFEDRDYLYLVFEKMRGGPLLNHIQRKVYFTEQEASMVTKDIASALKYLHDKGKCAFLQFLIAHYGSIGPKRASGKSGYEKNHIFGKTLEFGLS